MPRAHYYVLFLFIVVLLLCPGKVVAQGEPYHGDGIDDYLRFAPIAAVYVLKASGVEGASSWERLIVNSATSFVITTGMTWSLKKVIDDTRPDLTDSDAFPSGHSAFAFAGATVLHKEYGRVSPWISVAGYAVATATAVDRVCRNRHNWDDVVAGAAIGILSTEIGYWLGDKITGERSRYSVGVTPNGVSFAINL